MNHGKTINHLSRKKGHRRALMMNMANALIQHKRINTTLAKAKALRRYAEPLISKSKKNNMHSRRVVFGYLQSKEAVGELFENIGPKVMDRPGGYLRIIKTGFRAGDSAETAMIEFVDFNDVYDPKKGGKKKTRRSRRGGGSGKSSAQTQPAKKVAAKNEEEE